MNKTIIPNFCGCCGHKIPDQMKYRKTYIEGTPNEVRIAICNKCGYDLIFSKGNEKNDY